MTAFIGKKEVPLETAVARAGEILAQSRAPLIAGPGADVAGMRAVLSLAAKLGAAVDFCRGPGTLHLFETVRGKGMLFTTPHEARNRADVLLMLGPGAGRSEALIGVLEGQPVLSAGESARRDVLWLCPGADADFLSRFDIAVAEADFEAIHGVIASLGAAIRSRPMDSETYGGLSRFDYEEIAGRLITARYGVIAFSPNDLDALAMEALLGFAELLGKATRVMLLPLIGNAPERTATLVSCWTTGAPPRLSFARGYAEFDAWRNDAARLAQNRECDALLWVSPFAAEAPDWTVEMPCIALTPAGAVSLRAPDVTIETGVPGLEIDAELYSEPLQAITAVAAAKSSGAPSPAAILSSLLSHLEAKAA